MAFYALTDVILAHSRTKRSAVFAADAGAWHGLKLKLAAQLQLGNEAQHGQ